MSRTVHGWTCNHSPRWTIRGLCRRRGLQPRRRCRVPLHWGGSTPRPIGRYTGGAGGREDRCATPAPSGKGPPERAQDGTRVDRQPQSALDDWGLVPKAWAAASQGMSPAAALGVARRHARLDDTRARPAVAKIAAQRRHRPGKGPPEPAQDDKREERRAFVRFGERPRSPEEQTRFGLGDKQADSEGAARFSCLNGRGHSA